MMAFYCREKTLYGGIDGIGNPMIGPDYPEIKDNPRVSS